MKYNILKLSQISFDLCDAPSVIIKHMRNNDVQLCQETINLGIYSKKIKYVHIIDTQTNSITIPKEKFVQLNVKGIFFIKNNIVNKKQINNTFATWLYKQKKYKLCTNNNNIGRYIVKCILYEI